MWKTFNVTKTKVDGGKNIAICEHNVSTNLTKVVFKGIVYRDGKRFAELPDVHIFGERNVMLDTGDFVPEKGDEVSLFMYIDTIKGTNPVYKKASSN